ncbi:hypothetical protein HUG17_2313 [Dermatophagoides farinae]|uniref:Uncharacterized protein n=1 Tax=Dermatophagoides farinae TaxID=6954 RepID=A0A9D4PBB7_DERFA|nr:uncharacterized protein LOC124499167 [Dermatophagoides farinae]KAH7646775.1 hypothetical protein HUG17_2313 [Dermatophagoides farinae]
MTICERIKNGTETIIMIGPKKSDNDEEVMMMMITESKFIFYSRINWTNDNSNGPRLSIRSSSTVQHLEQYSKYLYYNCSYLSWRPTYMNTYLQTIKIDSSIRYNDNNNVMANRNNSSCSTIVNSSSSSNEMITLYYQKNLQFKNRFRLDLSSQQCFIDDFPSSSSANLLKNHRYFALSIRHNMTMANMHEEYFLLAKNLSHRLEQVKLLQRKQITNTTVVNETRIEEYLWNICVNKEYNQLTFIDADHECSQSSNERMIPLEIRSDDQKHNITGFIDFDNNYSIWIGVPEKEMLIVLHQFNENNNKQQTAKLITILTKKQLVQCQNEDD